MARLIYSGIAKHDLAGIWHYIRKYNPVAADQMIERINRKAELLSDYPLLGRVRPELWKHLRSFGVKPYLILYRPLTDGVRISRIVHGSRYLPGLI